MLKQLQDDIIKKRKRHSHDDAWNVLSEDFNRFNMELKSSHNTSTHGTSYRHSY